MTTTTIKLDGMTCDACERVITKRLSGISGIEDIKVNVQNGNVTATSAESLNEKDIQKALIGTHYKVISVG